jgi:hypothetical protein
VKSGDGSGEESIVSCDQFKGPCIFTRCLEGEMEEVGEGDEGVVAILYSEVVRL